MTSSCRILLAVMKRDLLIGWRGLSDSLAGVTFFAVVVALVPLALGPSPETLRLLGPAVIWIAALIAALPQMERLFQQDAADGSLDQLILTPLPLPVIVLAKVAAGWIIVGLPLVLMTPVIGLLLGLPLTSIGIIGATVAIGSVGLLLLGAMAAAITIGARRGGILMAVLILPLAMPILIFGTATANAASEGTPYSASLLFLSAIVLMLMAVTPVATAAGLRHAAE